MKRIFFIVISIIVSIAIVAPRVSQAASLQQMNGTIIVASEQTHFGNLFAFGNSLRIEGEVQGDLYVVANELVINGTIHGDILGIARKVVISGTVEGDVRVVTQHLELYGTVERNISFVADQATVRDTAVVKGTLTGVATNLTVLGSIGDSIEGKYTNLLLASAVGRNIDVSITNDFDSGLHLLATARIAGDLQYTALQPARISEGAIISGYKNYNVLAAGNERLWLIDLGDSNWWLARLAYFASLLLTTLLVWRFGNKRWREVAESMIMQPRKDLWYGLLLFVFVPVGAPVFILSLVGLPLGVVALLLYALVWYFYPVWACLYLTTVIGQRVKAVKSLPVAWQIILGLMIVITLGQLPFVGVFFTTIIGILTAGGLFDTWSRWWGAKK